MIGKEKTEQNLTGQQKTGQVAARIALTANSSMGYRGAGQWQDKHQTRTTDTEPASFPFYPAWAQKQAQVEKRKKSGNCSYSEDSRALE